MDVTRCIKISQVMQDGVTTSLPRSCQVPDKSLSVMKYLTESMEFSNKLSLSRTTASISNYCKEFVLLKKAVHF